MTPSPIDPPLPTIQFGQILGLALQCLGNLWTEATETLIKHHAQIDARFQTAKGFQKNCRRTLPGQDSNQQEAKGNTHNRPICSHSAATMRDIRKNPCEINSKSSLWHHPTALVIVNGYFQNRPSSTSLAPRFPPFGRRHQALTSQSTH